MIAQVPRHRTASPRRSNAKLTIIVAAPTLHRPAPEQGTRIVRTRYYVRYCRAGWPEHPVLDLTGRGAAIAVDSVPVVTGLDAGLDRPIATAGRRTGVAASIGVDAIAVVTLLA